MLKKYKYKVELSADDGTVGYVELTSEQAELVAHVTNTNNWEIIKQGQYSGTFEIDLKNPLEIEHSNATISDNIYKLYKKIMKYHPGAIDEIETLNEAKEIISMITGNMHLHGGEIYRIMNKTYGHKEDKI